MAKDANDSRRHTQSRSRRAETWDEFFAAMPRLHDLGSTHAMSVYAALKECDLGGLGIGVVNPGDDYLAARTHLSRRRVWDAKQRLIDDGLIEILEPGGGRGKSTVYRLIDVVENCPPERAVSQEAETARPSARNRPPQRTKPPATVGTNKKELGNTTTPAAGAAVAVPDHVPEELAATMNAASENVSGGRATWKPAAFREPVARWWAKGYVTRDFKRVIWEKSREWSAQAFRPRSLFGSKFAEYVGGKRWTVAEAEKLAETYGEERADLRLSIDGQNLADLRREAAEAAAAAAAREERERAEDAERQRDTIRHWIKQAKDGDPDALADLRRFRSYPEAAAYLAELDAGEQPEVEPAPQPKPREQSSRIKTAAEVIAELEARHPAVDRPHRPPPPTSPLQPRTESEFAAWTRAGRMVSATDLAASSARRVGGGRAEPEQQPPDDATGTPADIELQPNVETQDAIGRWLATGDRSPECAAAVAILQEHPPAWLGDHQWTWKVTGQPTTNDDGTPTGRLVVTFNAWAPFPATPEEAERLRQLDAERPELPRRPGITTVCGPEQAPEAWARLLRAYRESENTP